MLRNSKPYFLIAGGLLIIEILIARYAHDPFIRPYAGDFLATILLYCLLQGLLAARPIWVASAALLISYLIEGLQYADVLAHLGWQHSRLARIVLGSHFAWGDVLAYSLGALAVLATEKWVGSFRQRRPPVATAPSGQCDRAGLFLPKN